MNRKRVRARLQLLSVSEGGRTGPVRSGYRSLIRLEQGDVDFGFELDLENDFLAPGDQGNGTLSFWAVEELPVLLPGQRFEVREGARVIGHGVVMRDCPERC